jgi:ubiquinone/menaquinone biosynthesis C-methylase UbiE
MLYYDDNRLKGRGFPSEEEDMGDKPVQRIADLRYPLESIDPGAERWSQWSSAPMIELSARETYRFVREMIGQPHQRILEVGCGNGYLALELAREGHKVTGMDTSPTILEVAERSRAAHPDTAGFGSLTYACADITTWQAPDASFDIVIFNRSLHHLHDLTSALANVKRLLAARGRIICQDYAYDRLNEQTASWLYAMQRLFFLSGLSQDDPATGAGERASIEVLRTAWFQRAEQREHRLHRYEEMLNALQANFEPDAISWVPYLFVYIGNSIHAVAPQREQALLTFLREMEEHLIDQGTIQAVSFRYAGTRSER